MDNNWNKEIKFLKTRFKKAENAYKSYKNLFEQIKKLAKKLHFANLITKYKNNIKMTWPFLKEVLDKNSSRRLKSPNKINLE